MKARVEFKICLIVHRAITFKQPKCIVAMLSSPLAEIQVSLQSSNTLYRLHEPRAVNGRSFAYATPLLYNKLPVKVKWQTSLQGFKTHLKRFLFTQAYDTANNVLNEAYRL